jgi:hypothetical protein
VCKDAATDPHGDLELADIEDGIDDEEAQETAADIRNTVGHHGAFERGAHLSQNRSDVGDRDEDKDDRDISVIALVPSGYIQNGQ